MNSFTNPEIRLETIRQRHAGQERLEQALERQALARNPISRFVTGLVVAHRERQADEYLRAHKD